VPGVRGAACRGVGELGIVNAISITSSWRVFPGYVRRPDGTYARTVEIVNHHGGRSRSHETLVRDAKGRLLRVEHSARARTKRKEA